MTISKPFSATGYRDEKNYPAKMLRGQKLEKYWGSGSRIIGDSGYGEIGIGSLSHHYEGGVVCIRDGGEGNDDEGGVLVSQVCTRRGIKRKRTANLGFRVSSGKNKSMVYDDGVGDKHLVSQDFPECNIRADGFESGVSVRETKIRNLGLSCVSVEEVVGACEQVQRFCLNSLVSAEEDAVNDMGKKSRRRRWRKKKYKETEKNQHVVPEETLDREVSWEELEVEDGDDELVTRENQNPPSMNQRKRCASEFSHREVSVRRKRGVGCVERFWRGDIVWANLSDDEWWPGRVFKVRRLNVLVSILGQDKVCWLSVFQVLPFEENYVEKSKNAGGQLKVAIGNALEELGKRAALGLICLCEGLITFNENERSAVVDVPGYSESSHYTVEQILKARVEFRPLEMLSFLQKAALSAFSNESDTVVANRAIAQAKGYRRLVSIMPDWIYRETMRLTGVEHVDEPDKGSWEAEPLFSSLADNKVCDRAHRSLMSEIASEEVEEQTEVEETQDGRGDEGKKDNLMIVERKEREKEFQQIHLQKSNAFLSLEASHDKSRNKTPLQEEIKGTDESEEDKLDLNLCVTNEMDFSSLSSVDDYGLQISETPERTDVDVETNADDGKSLSDHRIKTVSSRANECKINNQEHVSVKSSLPSLFETLTHLHRLALDPFYDSDDVAFVFKALLRYRDVTFLNIANLKGSKITLHGHCEYSNSADPEISVSPSCVADSRNCATILHDFKKDNFEISSTLGGRENLKYSSFSSVPNSDMFSRSCQNMTNLASRECSSDDTKMPSLLGTLTDLRCLALDPFSGLVCAAFVSKAFLRYRAVTFLNIDNLRFSGGTLNHYLKSGKNAIIAAGTVLPSPMEQGNGTTSVCHARKDVFGLGAVPRERDKVKGVPGSAVLDDAMLSRISEQENAIAFDAVDKLKLDIKDTDPFLCETLTHLRSLALDPLYVPENMAFVCKTFLRYRAVSYSFSIFPSTNILSRPCQHMTAVASQECGSVDTKMPSLHDTFTHLRCLALDPLSGAVSVAFVLKAFLRYRAVTFLNITNIKLLDGTLNNCFKSGEDATRENDTVLSSVSGQGNGTTSDYHAKKGIFDVCAIAHEIDKGIPSSPVSDDPMLSSISEEESQEANIASNVVNKLMLIVRDNFSVEANVPSLREKLTQLHCLALDPFFDPQNTASLCKAFLRYRAASSSFSNDSNSYMLSISRQHITTLLSQKCSPVDTKMPSLLDTLAHLRSLALDPFSETISAAYVSSAFLRYRAVTFLNVTNLKFSEDTLSHRFKSGENATRETSKVLPFVTEQGNGTTGDCDAKKDTFEVGVLPHGRDRVKILALSEQTSGFSVAESCEKRGTSLFSHGTVVSSGNSGVGLLSKTKIRKLLDEVTQDESLTVDHGNANSNGGLELITSVKQHNFYDSPGLIARTQYLGSSLATASIGEIFMFLRCLACDVSYSGNHVKLVKQAFLRYRVASCHKNSVKYKPGLHNSFDHSESGSLLTKNWPNYVGATAMPGDRQSAATDRIPDVRDNKDASSDGGLPMQMATIDVATETCNWISTDQGQLCSSGVTTLLDEMYLLLRCLACDPFFGGEHSTSAKRAFLRYRVASYEKIYRVSSVEYGDGVSKNHENLVFRSLSKTWSNSRGITNRILNDSHKEKNVAPENETHSGNQCFSNTTTANSQTNGSGNDLLKCSGNNFPQKRKSDIVSTASPLHKLKKPCGAVLLSNWYASPLTRDGLSRSVKDVQVLTRNPTESTKIERFASCPENHDVSSYLHMKFPKNCDLPSQDQLMETFRRFGSIDCSKTRVFFYTGSGQVCFRRHADAEAAFKFARENVLFHQANIKFWVSSLAKLTHNIEGYNCTDSVRKRKSGESEKFASCPENHDVSSYLHMKFPKNCDLPSQDQLMETFRRFGSIDCSKTRVFFYTGSGQVCFRRHADAEAAFKFARENVLFHQANIKFWVSRLAKLTHNIQGYNCTDSVRKRKSGKSENDDRNLHIDEQELKDYDRTDGAQPLPVSHVRSCLRKLGQPGEKDRSVPSKVTISLDSQSCLPEGILNPLTLSCNHSLRKEGDIYQQKMLSLLKDCEQLIDYIRGSLGLESYYEMLIHELTSSFREPDE